MQEKNYIIFLIATNTMADLGTIAVVAGLGIAGAVTLPVVGCYNSKCIQFNLNVIGANSLKGVLPERWFLRPCPCSELLFPE